MVACAAMDPELGAARDSWRVATYDQQRSGGGGAGGVIFSETCERTLIIRDARVVRAGD